MILLTNYKMFIFSNLEDVNLAFEELLLIYKPITQLRIKLNFTIPSNVVFKLWVRPFEVSSKLIFQTNKLKYSRPTPKVKLMPTAMGMPTGKRPLGRRT